MVRRRRGRWCRVESWARGPPRMRQHEYVTGQIILCMARLRVCMSCESVRIPLATAIRAMCAVVRRSGCPG